MALKRHIGRTTNTDKRLVVLMMQLQDEKGNILDPEKAMVVDTDALPDKLHQPLMDIVESVEGQQETVLARLLSRRSGPDFGVDIFTSLSGGVGGANHISVVPIDQVLMYPEPNRPVPLRTVLEQIGSVESKAVEADSNTKFNPHAANSEANVSEEKAGIARNLLAEAQDFENIARAKREEAYKIAPSLRPAEPVAETKVETKAETPAKKAPAKRGRGRPKKNAA